MGNLLERIELPEGIRRLSEQQLEQLAEEIRALIIHTVSVNGGHLAPSLGTVELTLALYRVFHFPTDKLIWDVGHQAYTHKILTGRRESFATLRKKGGITGFPKRAESAYDAFGVGHASTSISAALGMAVARDLKRETHQVIAVIGDGALTGGEAFEALNHAGDLHRDMLVILNDNEMSIDKNVGGMSMYLSELRIAPQYHRAKRDMENLIKSIPGIGGKVLRTANSIKDGVKTALTPGGLFEEIGFQYIGPIDGHNLRQLQEVLVRVRELKGPILLHVHTKKGCGYEPAEQYPEKFHGIGRFDEETGEVIRKTESAPVAYTDVFSKALLDCAEKYKNLTAITAAMPSGTGLKAFQKAFPKRCFDVGIAEEHAMTLAAGMAAEGMRPVVALYSTFAQRAYDQILHDVCLQRLPVTICLDRAGLVGEDGPTHHGVFDLSYLRHMPHMSLLAPKDENELRQMLFAVLEQDGPAAIRYPRGAGIGVPVEEEQQRIPWGKAELLREGTDVMLLAAGSMVHPSLESAALLEQAGISAGVVNMRVVKPLDEAVLLQAAERKLVVTCEENALAGGLGAAVAEFYADRGILVPMLRFGIPDAFIEQGTRKELLELCGLLPEQIAERVKKAWGNL
ncbi:MAG: 1-deoxy-D-xylulose-5-phosphate synthase [Selenomonadaceae bacterium]|nr:1-deoxy-D-xylulose-5-phosphate synthase [Selenomonadaceae bacterium]